MFKNRALQVNVVKKTPVQLDGIAAPTILHLNEAEIELLKNTGKAVGIYVFGSIAGLKILDAVLKAYVK